MPRQSCARLKTPSAIICLIGTLACASVASAQMTWDQVRHIAHIRQSVVLIEALKGDERLGAGTGFVVDSKGLIVTNYHIIKGAEEVKATFPLDVLKKKYPVLGFTAVGEGKNLALIKIDPQEKQLAAVFLAKDKPTKGELLAVFGAPIGLSDTITLGLVSAIRSGEQLREMLKTSEEDLYKGVLGFDDDLTWIQTNAPIASGNAGGPMVNAEGEVIGICTFAVPKGLHLNFALSAADMRKFIESAAENKVRPFSELPKPKGPESKEDDSE